MNKLVRKLLASGGIDIHDYSSSPLDMGTAQARGLAGAIHMKDPESGQGGGSAGGQEEGGEGGDDDDAGDAGSEDDGTGAGDDKGGDDKPKMSDKEAQLLKEVMALKQKTQKVKGDYEATTKELSALKASLGDMSIEDLTKHVQEKKDAEIKELESKQQYDRVVERMRNEQKAVLDAKQAEIDSQVQEIATLKKTVEKLGIGQKFSNSTYISKHSLLPATIAQREFGAHFETDPETGNVIAFDKPAGSADRTLIVDANGEPKGFEDAIGELYAMHPDFKSITRPTAKPGITGNEPKTVKVETAQGGNSPRGLAKIQAGLSTSKS